MSEYYNAVEVNGFGEVTVPVAFSVYDQVFFMERKYSRGLFSLM